MSKELTEEEQEIVDLLNWAWGPGNVPGLVLAYRVSGRESLLNAMRRIREQENE